MFVSDNKEGWEFETLCCGQYVFAYVCNFDNPDYSEFWDIIISSFKGALIRIGEYVRVTDSSENIFERRIVMERRRITVFDKSKEFQKIEQNKCNEMIINDILNPLLQIIYALRESDNFNNIPGTDVGKKQAGTITQANLIIFTEPLTATYFFQNINTEKFTKQYREFTHTQESFQVLTACRTFSLKQTKICITTHLHSARTENAVKII